MIDFISAIKYDCKDSAFLGNCELVHPVDKYGNARYYLQGCEKMKVTYNVISDWIKVEGSLPYYLNGHNFKFPDDQCVKAIENINAMLGDIDLWDAYVNTFESGVIIEVGEKPSDYIAHHHAVKGSKLKMRVDEKDQGRFALWHRAGEDIKIYDEGARIRQIQSKARRQEVMMSGWNPDQFYLKYEIRFTRPEWINANRSVKVRDLTEETFKNTINRNLMDQYHLLSPTRSLAMPTDKDAFSSLDVALITMSKLCDLSPEQMQDKMYKTINETGFDKKDKDARKRTIKAACQRLVEMPDSKWDLTDRIEQELLK